MEIQNYNIYNFTPHFKSCSRNYENELNPLALTGSQIKTMTSLYRSDIDWDKLVKTIDDNFKDKKSINTYCIACSDGTEAYSYAIALNENLDKEKLKKYNRIIASDLDKESINVAKSGKLNLFKDDVDKFENIIKSPLKKYFINKSKPINIKNNLNFSHEYYHSYEPTEKIKNMVEFNQSDMIKQLKTMKDDGNSVVLCRNVAPYLSERYRYDLVETLKNKMHDGSILVIGNFDNEVNFADDLKRTEFGYPAFKEIDKNVFVRVDPLGLADFSYRPDLDTNRVFSKELNYY